MALTKIDEEKIFVIMGGYPAAPHVGTQFQVRVGGLTKRRQDGHDPESFGDLGLSFWIPKPD